MIEEINPLDFLKPYQLQWVLDRSRFKIWLASRQIGKSFGTAFEVVLDANETGQDWIILSGGERQARDFIRKVGQIADMIDDTLIAESYESQVEDTTTLTIVLRNGAIIRAVPANPHTARGFSANVVLDEFAFHENPDEIWRAVFPIITNTISGEKKLRIMSTPSGKNNKFFDIWGKGEGLNWSRHKTTIYDARDCGIFTQEQIDELKAALNDPDGWSQEYECNFLEEATQYFTSELVDSCLDPRATTDTILTTARPEPRFGGLDIGRHHDLSVFYGVFKDEKDKLVTEEVLAMRKMPFETQQKLVGERLPFLRRFAVDASGMGEETGERLQLRFGEAKVEACKFTQEFKLKIFPGLKAAMQKGLVGLPLDPAIKADLLTIEKQVTQGGTVRFVAARTDDGHADITNALALAVYAGSEPVGQWTKQAVRAARVPQRSPFAVKPLRF